MIWRSWQAIGLSLEGDELKPKPELAELIDRMRLFEADHTPDGWPAIQMQDVSALCDAAEGLASATGALHLLAHVRQALGDNGTRMQDELIEYCRELRDAMTLAKQAIGERDHWKAEADWRRNNMECSGLWPSTQCESDELMPDGRPCRLAWVPTWCLDQAVSRAVSNPDNPR